MNNIIKDEIIRTKEDEMNIKEAIITITLTHETRNIR